MLRIAIVEDDLKDADLLRACLAQFTEEHGVGFHVELFTSALSFFQSFRSDYDIVFMDIEMPTMNGLEAAARLRKLDTQVLLVFITNMAQYAIQGYAVEAFDYILKPINYYGLALKLRRLVTRANTQTRDEISLRTSGATIRLALRSVRYLEVDGHYVTWHTENDIFRTLDSLKSIEERLPPYYCSISRWNIVNLNFITSVAGNDVYLGQDVLRIGRYRKQSFLKSFAEYMVGGGRH